MVWPIVVRPIEVRPIVGLLGAEAILIAERRLVPQQLEPQQPEPPPTALTVTTAVRTTAPTTPTAIGFARAGTRTSDIYVGTRTGAVRSATVRPSVLSDLRLALEQLPQGFCDCMSNL